MAISDFVHVPVYYNKQAAEWSSMTALVVAMIFYSAHAFLGSVRK